MYTRNRRLTAEARRWKQDAGWLIQDARLKQGWVRREGREKLVLRLWVYWPDARRRDTHNLHKLLLDAAEGIAYADDRWVLARDMDFCVDREKPRVEVEITEAKA